MSLLPLVLILVGSGSVTTSARAETCTSDTASGAVFQIVCLGANGATGPRGKDATFYGNHDNDGGPGKDGETAGSGSIGLGGFTLLGRRGTPTFIASGSGGRGGDGGAGGGIGLGGFSDGGNAGRGGNGFGVTYSLTNATIGDGGNALSPVNMFANGGTGGAGGSGGNYGAGGAGGAGGSGGSLVLNMTSVSVTSTGPGITAVNLQANGGNGGNAQSAKTWVNTAQGKTGGAGGSGGSINATFSGTITSAGGGVFAASLGGNGGNGGQGLTTGLGGANGGNGGSGGGGGPITLTLAGGTIVATGAAQPGTGQKQTTQGGGSITFSAPVAAMQALVAGGLGGSAGGADGGFSKGTGGSGGSVGSNSQATIDNRGGAIATNGYAASGMLAQNIGGGGGNGAYGGGVFVAKGGSGSPGGTAGPTKLTAEGGSTRTTGDGSDGMAAQSIGGGGGYGGDASVAGVIVGVTIGGDSESGGAGGGATVYNGISDKALDTIAGGQLIVTAGAKSDAILAQSIGGGGGVAGDATSLVVGGVFSVAVGGKAGVGGAGGLVQVANGGVIQTGGASAYGVDAQSVGGGGGDGGAANSLLIGAQLTVSSAVGGSGGTGGTGGGVIASNANQIVTNGANSVGIYAQSVGGGGGHGGTSLSRTIQVYNDPRVPSVNLNVSLGGKGGSGGVAGNVSVSNTGAVATTGSGADAIVAQSVGGGGGNGGDADALNQALQSANISVTTVIGGAGGSGGNGGAVTVANTGLIYTLNNDAHAVFAQSVGGGGGTGGYGENNTGSVRAQDMSAQVSVAVGGSGGASGAGGAVTVNNTSGGIFTIGNKSFGVFAQSIGGGGGDGGGAVDNAGGGGKLNVNVAVGGSGGAGGAGGKVTLTNNAAIVTFGGSSSAVYAQSVGGGGGVGGDAAIGTGSIPLLDAANFIKDGLGIGAGTSSPDGAIFVLKQFGGEVFKDVKLIKKAADSYLALNPTDPKTPKASVKSQIDVNIGGGVAGKGGSAGNGGLVDITNTGGIETDGAFSEGVFAQSVGGGGGNGGAAQSANAASVVNGSFGVGGAGGSSGNGGAVTIGNSGAITTLGDISFGVFAQSVGGGGGKGGVSIGDPAILTNLTVNVGGSGGANGQGGAVTLTNSGTVSTAGRDATALVAQSIGGGGGLEGLMTVGDPATGGSGESQSGYLPHTAIIPVTVGGANGASGNGGVVTANVSGTVSTQGADAYGVLGQSIGGGGGLVVGVPGKATVTTADGAFGGGKLTGNGGAVRIAVTGNGSRITTSGAGAAGILAQSLGGGGALIGGLSQVDLGKPVSSVNSTLHSGQGGDIAVTVGAGSIITTNGARAPGVFAQSAGGGGGLYGHADGSGFAVAGAGAYGGCGSACSGMVNVNVTGFIFTNGADADGIYASSRGNGKNGVHITLASGQGIVAANGPGAASIYIDSPGGTNRIDNVGYIGGGSGIAIDGDSAASIYNSVWIRGDIISSIPNAYTITNYTSGRIYTGSMIMSGGTFNNAGELWLDKGATNQTTITSNLLSTGRIISGVNFAAGKADQVTVQGTATISGQVFIDPLSILAGSATVLRANSLNVGALSVTNFGYNYQTDAIYPIVPLDYYYTYVTTPTTLSITLVPHFNFAGAGAALSADQKSVGVDLQQLATATAASATPSVITAIYQDIGSFPQYQVALEDLGAHAYSELGATRSAEARAFAGAMTTCRSPTSGDGVEGNCLWGRASGGTVDRDGSQDGEGFHLRTTRIEFGGQKQFRAGWFVGGGLQYANARLDESASLAQITGDQFHAGIFIKRQAGRLTLSVAAAGGEGWYDSHRMIAVGVVNAEADGSPRLQDVGGYAHAAYELPLGRLAYLRPMLDLGVTHVHADGLIEHGSIFSLDVAPAEQTTLSAQPAVELGGRWRVGQTTLLRPYVSVGGGFYGNNSWTTEAAFLGDEQLVGPFQSRTRLPGETGRVGGGIEVLTSRALSVSLSYEGELSRNYASHQGLLKAALTF